MNTRLTNALKDSNPMLKVAYTSDEIEQIRKTVKGKGVSFMENQVGWHGTAPNDEQYAVAMEELEKAGEALCQK